MEILHTVAALRAARSTLPGRVGFVPTMGALHEGHVGLINTSAGDCDATIISVYVNPTQFDNPDDLARYPETLARDAEIAAGAGAVLLFAPSYAEMYPDDYHYRVDETDLSRELCGAHRPGHFTGVLTVVMKLLNIVAPDVAYFGEKDFQQLQLIRGMAEAFFLNTEIRGCSTVREADGLALSSRNVNLDSASRSLAPMLHALMDSPVDDRTVAAQLAELGFDVDYVVSRFGRRLAAARLGGVRLIDNIPMEETS